MTYSTDRNLFARHCQVVRPVVLFFGPDGERPHCAARRNVIPAPIAGRLFVEVGAGGLPVKSFSDRAMKPAKSV